MNISRLVVITLSILIMGCDPGQPSGTVEFEASGYAAPLTQQEFNSLPAEEQYLVANKLLGTMLRGVSAEDFFDLSVGTEELQVQANVSTFLTDLKASLKTDVGLERIAITDAIIDGLDAEGNPTLTPKYEFDTTTNIRTNNRPRQLPLARIKEYPIGSEFFNHWMAYFLANTIMFSPAYEMETTDMGDVQSMYRFLVSNLSEDKPVREIVRSNLPTLARWRVSRSPENHALEAYELYLGLFETEVDSYRGGIACRDIYLTPESQDYLIRQTDFANTVPQLILETYYVTNCNDLYDVIAGHPLLMPRATEVLINYFMSGRSLNDRINMIDSITASGAQTFEDIFLSILFSREYLLNTERPRSFEESIMPMLDTLKWSSIANRSPVDERIFINMASNTGNRLYLTGMGWDSMSLKIGRLPDVPLDGLSFGNYHKALREFFLMQTGGYKGGIYDFGGEDVGVEGLFFGEDGALKTVIAEMSLNDVINMLFLNALQRRATTVEQDDLVSLFVAKNYLTSALTGEVSLKENNFVNAATITYDYISRLPELYYFKAINQGG